MNRGRADGVVGRVGGVWLAVCLVALVLTGCGGAGAASGDKLTPVTSTRAHAAVRTSTTTLPPTTTTTLPVIPGVDPTLEKTVWDAYLAAWAAVDEASSTSDPNFPGLAQHLTNAELRRWQDVLTQRDHDGEYTYFRPSTRHGDRLYGVTVRHANWLDLDTCQFDDGVLAVRATHAVVDDVPAYSRRTVTMWLVDGTWRMAGNTGGHVAEDQCPGL